MRSWLLACAVWLVVSVASAQATAPDAEARLRFEAGQLAFHDLVVSAPPEYDPDTESNPVPSFIYWVLDIEHYEGGSLTVIGDDGVQRTVTVTRPAELTWPAS